MLVAVFGYIPTVFQGLDVGEYRSCDDHSSTTVFNAVDFVGINQLVDSSPTAFTTSTDHRLRYGHTNEWGVCGDVFIAHWVFLFVWFCQKLLDSDL